MNANRYSSGDYTNNAPDWYWRSGLHDAEILFSEFLDLPFDYKTRNPIRNSFSLKINSKDALYDTAVKSISFLNCKILTPDVSLDRTYWLQDILTFKNNKYILEITVTDCKRESVSKIQFDSAEVMR